MDNTQRSEKWCFTCLRRKSNFCNFLIYLLLSRKKKSIAFSSSTAHTFKNLFIYSVWEKYRQRYQRRWKANPFLIKCCDKLHINVLRTIWYKAIWTVATLLFRKCSWIMLSGNVIFFDWKYLSIICVVLIVCLGMYRLPVNVQKKIIHTFPLLEIWSGDGSTVEII